MPQELVDDIIDHIEDLSLLSTTALIARAWRTQSQKRQYHTINIRGKASLQSLHKLLLQSPQLGHRVITLCYDHGQRASREKVTRQEVILSIAFVCNGMLNVEEIRLKGVAMLTPATLEAGFHFLASLPKLSTLYFSTCTIDAVLFPLLVDAGAMIQSLSLSNCNYQPTTSQPPSKPLNPPGTIRSLAFDGYSWSQTIVFQPYPSLFCNVKRFDLDCSKGFSLLEDGLRILDLLTSMKDSLEYLRMIWEVLPTDACM